MTTKPVRVAMWSGPRNLSTAMMRAWENRPDTEVLDEPLYAHYLDATGLNHPGRDEILATYPTSAAQAIARCLARAPAGIDIVFQKHMSHHLLPGMEGPWLDSLRHVLLIRHPVEVLASFTAVHPEAEATITVADLGLPQQLALAERAELILDAGDFLIAPENYLAVLCETLDVPVQAEAMTRWPAGSRPSDGCWSRFWYQSVEASTGFGPPVPPSRRAQRADLAPRLQAVADEAVDLYDVLASHRLVL